MICPFVDIVRKIVYNIANIILVIPGATTTVNEVPENWYIGHLRWLIETLNPNLSQSVPDVSEIQMVFRFVENTNPFQQ